MIIHTLSLNLVSNSFAVSPSPYKETGGSENVIDAVIPASSTNFLQSITITAANLQSFWMVASTNVTILTNSTSSPGNTLNLKAGIPFVWSISPGYFASPFTSNVTAFYYTNSTVPTSITARILTS